MNNNNLAVVQQSDAGGMTMQPNFGSQGLLADFEKVRAMQELANIMATAKVTVPAHLAGKAGDCLAVVMQAAQWQMNPFAVAQKTHVVNGTLGYEAQLVNAVVQASGAIAGRFHYEYQGDGANVACRVGAVIRGEKEITWGEWLSAATVTTKNSPLWKTNPKQQLGYLQVKNWARAYCPGAILGVYSDDELEAMPARDMGNAEVIDDKPASNTRTEALKSHLGAGKKKPAVTLDQVIDGLNAASTPEQLLAAAELAKTLSNEDKAKAGAAYTTRLHQLKAAAQGVDTATGEVTDPDDAALRHVEQPDQDAISYADVASSLEKAANRDDFDAACDLIQYLSSAGDRDRLSGIVKRRLEEFKAK